MFFFRPQNLSAESERWKQRKESIGTVGTWDITQQNLIQIRIPRYETCMVYFPTLKTHKNQVSGSYGIGTLELGHRRGKPDPQCMVHGSYIENP